MSEVNLLGWNGPLRDDRDGVRADLNETSLDEDPSHGVGCGPVFATDPHLACTETADERRMSASHAALAVKEGKRNKPRPRVEAGHLRGHDDTAKIA